MYMRILRGVCLCAVLTPALSLAQAIQGYTINTFAGIGTSGYAGDGGSASAAQFNLPCGLALDSSGNLYIGDSLNSRVRKIDAGGNISTVAGNGTKGYFGDTGAATSGGISYPCKVAVDRSGNLYIADASNHAVRKVSSSGTLTTFAGGHDPGFSGDGGKATDAHVNYVGGVAVDSLGNVYLSDSNNHRIRKVTTDGMINTIAGTGSQGLVGDGGPATSAWLNYPLGLAVDSSNNLYIADTFNHAVRKITSDGTITTIAGTGLNGFSGDGGPATKAQLNYPKDIAVGPDGVVYIADTLNNRIRAVSPNGTISTIAGGGYFGDGGDGGPALAALLRFPSGIAADNSGRVYLADTQNYKIKLLTPNAPPEIPNAPPSISLGGVITAASFGAAKSISPGSWIEIYGQNFATISRAWTAGEFVNGFGPTALQGASVTVGGVPAYVSYVSPGQVNAQVPFGIGTGPQLLMVTTPAGVSASYSITVADLQPGLYAPGNFLIGGKQYLGALLPDGVTYVLPAGALQGIPARPARPGETIVLYGVGFGAVNPPVAAGQVAPQAAALTAPVTVKFGDTPAAVAYAGISPGSVGLYQINVTVPAIPDNNAVPVTVAVGGVAIPQTLYTAVRQ
jgi:uncharacterized protein (TIGR03437 family)